MNREGTLPNWVAVHGFTQRGSMMEELVRLVRHRAACPDLPGHGAASGILADVPTTLSTIFAALETCAPPSVLLGYSQGGRMAVLAALGRPELVRHLILVSASPGLENIADREQRRASDEMVARRIESDFDAFLEEWAVMFPGLSRRGSEWLRSDLLTRKSNSAAGLAAALRGYGQGSQPSAWDRLADLSMPVTLVVGSDDEKYCAIAKRMSLSLRAVNIEVLNGGHALVGENPSGLADIVRRVLSDTSLGAE
jgi:2-succinyl-6-hydroxy-2,4-cyclohexadiene-1-carboxylate synthase